MYLSGALCQKFFYCVFKRHNSESLGFFIWVHANPFISPFCKSLPRIVILVHRCRLSAFITALRNFFVVLFLTTSQKRFNASLDLKRCCCCLWCWDEWAIHICTYMPHGVLYIPIKRWPTLERVKWRIYSYIVGHEMWRRQGSAIRSSL